MSPEGTPRDTRTLSGWRYERERFPGGGAGHDDSVPPNEVTDAGTETQTKALTCAMAVATHSGHPRSGCLVLLAEGRLSIVHRSPGGLERREKVRFRRHPPGPRQAPEGRHRRLHHRPRLGPPHQHRHLVEPRRPPPD